MSRDPHAGAGLPRAALLMLAAGTFVAGADGFILSGLLLEVSEGLAVTPAVAGQLATAFSLTYALGAPVAAAAVGRWRCRSTIAVGLGVFAVGMLIQAAGPDFALVLCGRVLSGVGAAVFQPAAFALAGRLAPAERRGRALGVVAAGMSLSMVVGVPLGIWLGQLGGWRLPLYALTVAAVAVAASALSLPRTPGIALPLLTRLRAFTDPTVLRLLATTVALFTPGFLLITYLAPVLGTTAGSAPVLACILAFGAGEVAGLQLAGRLADRRSPLSVLTLGAVGNALAIGLLGSLGTSPVLAAAAAGLVGVCGGLLTTPQQVRLLEVGNEHAPVALGLNGSAVHAAGAVGAAVGGVALAGAGAGGAMTAAVVVAVGAAVLTVVLAPERRRLRITD